MVTWRSNEDVESRFFLGKTFLCTQSLSEHIAFGHYKFPISLVMPLSKQQSGVNALHILIALNLFTLVCNVMTVLVEVVKSAIVRVENF